MATIQGIYLALFGRPADPAGLAYYNGVTNNGGDLSGIGNLAGQKEYLDRFSGMSSAQIVQSIYQSLFGRAGEQAGIDFWVGRLASGALTINNIAIAILDGATGTDKQTVDAKIAAADLFSSHLDLPSEQKAYDATTVGRARDYIATIDASHPGTAAAVDALIAQNQTSAGQGLGGSASGGDNGGGGSGSSSPGGTGGSGGQGSIFILTGPDAGITGHDVIAGTAGDDAIYAIDPKSITSNDIIHGGAGNDTLYIRPQAAGLIANGFSPFIDGVETIHNANGDVLVFDLSHVTGVNTLWSDTDTYYLNADVQTVFGLGNGNANLSFASDLSGDNTVLKLALNTGGTSAVNSEFEGRAIERASLEMLSTNFGTVQFGRGMDALTEIDVTGAGKGGITFDQSGGHISIFDSSANQGGVNADISASDVLKTVIGGSGSDTLTLSASNGGYSIATGAGSDTLKFGISIAQFHIAVDPVGITEATPAALDDAMITVTDFDAAHDTLVLTGISYALAEQQQGDVSGAASLWAAANLAASYAHAASATDKLVSFHYGGDTYVYNDADSNGAVSKGDGIIKLAGVTTDLTDLNYQHG